MPIYKYLCSECGEESMYMHSSEELKFDCEKCNLTNTLSKMLNKPNIIKSKNENKKSKVGEVTKQYIEDNREILKQQKEELKKKTYDKS
tara:strand:+ start:6208 stop:6474 length:267 start_codon:yes stop_codon:yes gene_type:complete